MQFEFYNNGYEKYIRRIGIKENRKYTHLSIIILPVLIAWLPLSIYTLIQGTFWTGEIGNSFITSFDLQARLLISIPLLLLAAEKVSSRISSMLNHFIQSGIVPKSEEKEFVQSVERKLHFLKLRRTDFIIILICYLQVIVVLIYELNNTSMISWQIDRNSEIQRLNFAGWWSTIVSRPFILFLFYQWLLRIFIWGRILRGISKMKIQLFPMHPDACGGLGFIGGSIRYFAPVVLALSFTIAGTLADQVLIEGVSIMDLRFGVFAYLIFLVLIFSIPLFAFTKKLLNAKEESIYRNSIFANAVYMRMQKKLSKDYDQVKEEDLISPDISSATDLSTLIQNAQQMKVIPFTLKDFIPILTVVVLPLLPVVLLEIPISELIGKALVFLA